MLYGQIFVVFAGHLKATRTTGASLDAIVTGLPDVLQRALPLGTAPALSWLRTNPDETAHFRKPSVIVRGRL